MISESMISESIQLIKFILLVALVDTKSNRHELPVGLAFMNLSSQGFVFGPFDIYLDLCGKLGFEGLWY